VALEDPLLALTLWQPWAWCIAHGTKRVENREWPPPETLLGHRFAIHAGRHYDAAGVALLTDRRSALGLAPGEPPPEHEIVRGAIVAVATLAGAVRVTRREAGASVAKRWLGHLDAARIAMVERDPWTQGAWGWLLEDVVAIEPVSCPGNRKLWIVPAPIAEAVRAAEAAARTRRDAALRR
jgi:hypothetical protein